MEDSLTFEQIKTLIPNAAVATLGQNCRNTPDMVDIIDLFVQPEIYKGIRRPYNHTCLVKYYTDEKHQQKLLGQTLEELESANFKGSDIVVLSSVGSNKSCAESIDIKPWAQKLVRFGQHTGGHIPHTTIHRFKGLEAPAIVVTDITDMNQHVNKSLLYIAMTRATDRFVVFVSEEVRDQFISSIQSN